jgi:hypothetical protein
MEDFKTESIDLIKELIETINWLGGDGYEMEAIQNTMDKANKFIDENTDAKIEESAKIVYLSMWDMVFVLRDNETCYTVAQSKRQAKNKFNTSLANVKCVIPSLRDTKSITLNGVTFKSI